MTTWWSTSRARSETGRYNRSHTDTSRAAVLDARLCTFATCGLWTHGFHLCFYDVVGNRHAAADAWLDSRIARLKHVVTWTHGLHSPHCCIVIRPFERMIYHVFTLLLARGFQRTCGYGRMSRQLYRAFEDMWSFGRMDRGTNITASPYGLLKVMVVIQSIYNDIR